MALGLKKLGYPVKIYICDGVLPICHHLDHRFIGYDPDSGNCRHMPVDTKIFCGICKASTALIASIAGFRAVSLKNLYDIDLGRGDVVEEGPDAITHSESLVARIVGRPVSATDGQHQTLLDLVRYSSRVSSALGKCLSNNSEPRDLFLIDHGIYVPQGPLVDSLRMEGRESEVLVWDTGPTRGLVYVCRGGSVHDFFQSRPERSDLSIITTSR